MITNKSFIRCAVQSLCCTVLEKDFRRLFLLRLRGWMCTVITNDDAPKMPSMHEPTRTTTLRPSEAFCLTASGTREISLSQASTYSFSSACSREPPVGTGRQRDATRHAPCSKERCKNRHPGLRRTLLSNPRTSICPPYPPANLPRALLCDELLSRTYRTSSSFGKGTRSSFGE